MEIEQGRAGDRHGLYLHTNICEDLRSPNPKIQTFHSFEFNTNITLRELRFSNMFEWSERKEELMRPHGFSGVKASRVGRFNASLHQRAGALELNERNLPMKEGVSASSGITLKEDTL